MIPDLQSAEHFEPVSLWDAALYFPIYAIDRFEKPRDDGAVSVAAARRAQAQSALFWAEQLMHAVGKDKTPGHPFLEGFMYTSKFPGAKGYADWCILPFEMAQCLRRHPPQDADFDYSDFKFVSRRLAAALPRTWKKMRPAYDPNLADYEYEEFLEQFHGNKL